MLWLEASVHGIKEFDWLPLDSKSEPPNYEESLCPLNLFWEIIM